MTGRRLTACTVVATLVAAFGGCTVIIAPPGDVEEDFSLSAPLDAAGSLLVDWGNGDVSVIVDDTVDQIAVTGTKRVLATSREAADEAMINFDIEIDSGDEDNPQTIVRFDAPQFDVAVIYVADVEVRVPAGITLTVESAAGTVRVQGNTNHTGITVENGDVVVLQQNGDADVDVGNGDVQIESMAGDVEVTGQTGRVTVSADPGETGSLTVAINVGSIALAVPADTPASLTLGTDVGSIDANLEGFNAEDVHATGKSLTATLNGGGGEIDARTNTGNVSFEALQP